MLARKEKVEGALKWLKVNNPLYKNINISVENLAILEKNPISNASIIRTD